MALAEYAIVDDGVVIEYRSFEEVPVLPGKPYRVFLPVEEVNPVFDPATQIRTGPVITILSDRVTRVFTVTNKTAAELAADVEARKEGAIARVEVQLSILGLYRILFDHENRIRARETPPDPPLSLAEFRVLFKALI